MKRMTILGLLLCLWAILSAYGQINLNLDLGGEMTYKGNGLSQSIDVNTALSPAIEIMSNTPRRIVPGFGIEFQFPRGFDVDGASDDYTFHYIPFYGVLKLKATNDPRSPELVINAGYNILNGSSAWKEGVSLKNGFCYGVGGALNLNNFVITLMYKVNNGGATSQSDYYESSQSIDIVYSHISLTAGVRIGQTGFGRK